MAIFKKTVDTEGFIKWFSDIKQGDFISVGNKAANLGEIFHNFSVPLGFVVTKEAFDYFLSKNSLKEKINEIISKITDVENLDDLKKVSIEIRSLIEDNNFAPELENEVLEAYHILSSDRSIDRTGISETAFNILKNSYEPVFVSIRASPIIENPENSSFAGLHDVFLNTKGDRQLILNLKKCFSSFFTPRAIYYRHKKGLNNEIKFAVVVEKMVESEKSGVIFSKNPVDTSESIIIDAIFGLGEANSTGKISPDNYIVSKNLEIKHTKVSEKKIAILRNGSGENSLIKLNNERAKTQVLSNGEITRLADLGVQIEEIFKKPQFIEWAIEEGKLFILQVMPITSSLEKKSSEHINGNKVSKGIGASSGIASGIVELVSNLEELKKSKKEIIVIPELENSEAIFKSVGVISKEGGISSNPAIILRELEIPLIIESSNERSLLKSGMKISIDGKSGDIYAGEITETKTNEVKTIVQTNRVRLRVIIDSPKNPINSEQLGINSAFIKLERIISDSGIHPKSFENQNKLEEYSEILSNGISEISNNFKSIFISSLDIKSDELNHLSGAPEKEFNPFFGLRGIRFSLKYPRIFEAEVSAIKKVSLKYPEKKFALMLPHIISLDEIKKAREYFNKYRTQNMELGIIIETPAAVQIIEDICKSGIRFISIETDDLTNLTLGVDKENKDVSHLYDELSQPVYSQIKRVIGICKTYRVETNIYGKSVNQKEMIEFLFKQGVSSISVNPENAFDVSLIVKNLEEEWKKNSLNQHSKNQNFHKKEFESKKPVINNNSDQKLLKKDDIKEKKPDVQEFDIDNLEHLKEKGLEMQKEVRMQNEEELKEDRHLEEEIVVEERKENVKDEDELINDETLENLGIFTKEKKEATIDKKKQENSTKDYFREYDELW